MTRKITLDEAKRRYVHRFTMEHVPHWTQRSLLDQRSYCAPQFRTDQEWYDNTIFPGEGHIHRNSKHCETNNLTWPVGQCLLEPYKEDKK